MIRFKLLIPLLLSLLSKIKGLESSLLNGSCLNNNCVQPYSSCLNGICQCNDGYFNDGLKCVKLNKGETLDFNCKSTVECKAPTEVCVLGQCKCAPNYVRFDWNCWPSLFLLQNFKR